MLGLVALRRRKRRAKDFRKARDPLANLKSPSNVVAQMALGEAIAVTKESELRRYRAFDPGKAVDGHHRNPSLARLQDADIGAGEGGCRGRCGPEHHLGYYAFFLALVAAFALVAGFLAAAFLAGAFALAAAFGAAFALAAAFGAAFGVAFALAFAGAFLVAVLVVLAGIAMGTPLR
jgi:hypothetical protein